MLKLPSFDLANERKPSDTELVAVYQDKDRKAVPPKGPHSAAVTQLRKDDVFTARSASIEYLRYNGACSAKTPSKNQPKNQSKHQNEAKNVVFVGFGQASTLTEESIRVTGGTAWAKLSALKARAVTIDLDSMASADLPKNLSLDQMAGLFAEGLALASYRFDKYKTKSSNNDNGDYRGPEAFYFRVSDSKTAEAVKDALDASRAAAEAVAVTRDWSNEPSNIGTPAFFASEAQRLARANGLSCKILSDKDAKRERMNLFLSVGQGSVRESKIVIVEYKPQKKNLSKGRQKTLVLAGKGVTFDSGGISIKPSARMNEMKHDMTGAATVMGAMILAAKWKARHRIIGIMAFTENMPDGKAIQPGNVITSRAGKTVEIVNTDAEGRLVLADILDYAQDMKPDYLIDVATLTGAVSVALGKYCCGLMGNDDKLIAALNAAGGKTGERMWQLPLYDEYFDDLKSDTADMKNSGSDSYGGTIRGAAFLKQFIRKGTSWVHMDIASTAYNLSHLSYCPKKGASGCFVRSLAQLSLDL